MWIRGGIWGSGGLTRAVTLAGLLASSATHARPSPPPNEVVDPEEVVTDEGDSAEFSPPDSLCVIHESADESKFVFVTYATHDMWRPCRGRNRSPMSYADFYKAIGRPDLLNAHDRISATEAVLFWSQLALTLSAFGFTAAALLTDNTTYWWPAGGAFAGAATLSVIRGSQSPLPIDSDAAVELASRYNSGSDRAHVHGPAQSMPVGSVLYVPIVAGRF